LVNVKVEITDGDHGDMKEIIIFVVVTTIAVATSYYGLTLFYTTILGGLYP